MVMNTMLQNLIKKTTPKKQIQATKPLEWFLVFFLGGASFDGMSVWRFS